MTKEYHLSPTPAIIEANNSSSTSTPPIHTPSASTSPHSKPSSRRHSPYKATVASKARQSPPPRPITPVGKSQVAVQSPGVLADDSDLEEDADMNRPPSLRPTDGRSQTPLLKDERGRHSYDGPNGSARPAFLSRRSTFRSKSPEMETSSAVKKKYTYAAFFLMLSLVSFVIQTETAVYIQHELKWNKAYAML